MLARLARLLICTVVLLGGCQAGFPPKSDDSNSNTNDNGAIPPEDPGDDPPVDGPAAELTVRQAEAVAASLWAAEQLAGIAAGLAPAADAEGIVNGGGPSCPAIDGTLGASELVLSLSYGLGCMPEMIPGANIAGELAGSLFYFVNAFEMQATGLDAGGGGMSGRLGGGLAVNGEVTTFAVNVDVAAADGQAIRGAATLLVDGASGGIEMASGTVTVTYGTGAAEPGGTVSLSFEDVPAGVAASGRLLPFDGLCRFTVEESDGAVFELKVWFTAETASAGTVLVSIDHADALPFAAGG